MAALAQRYCDIICSLGGGGDTVAICVWSEHMLPVAVDGKRPQEIKVKPAASCRSVILMIGDFLFVPDVCRNSTPRLQFGFSPVCLSWLPAST